MRSASIALDYFFLVLIELKLCSRQSAKCDYKTNIKIVKTYVRF